jgi:hypothetical protein
MILALLLGSVPAWVRADAEDELRSLREQAAQLRRSLDELDARIRTLESARGGEATARPAAPAAGSAAALKRSWSEIRPGTPEERVSSILGKPERVLLIDGSTVWYYVYPDFGRGSVFFDGSGKVSSAQSPSLGWGW